MTLVDDHSEERGSRPRRRPSTAAAGRWNSAGVPGERSKDFKHALRRLARHARPDVDRARRRVRRSRSSSAIAQRARAARPRARHRHHRARASTTGQGIDFAALHRDAARRRSALYVASAVLSIIAVVPARGRHPAADVRGCAPTVEDKINVLPLSYIDKQARGDLLSRVTNDIDNVAQSLQQTLSQMLTSVLLLIGVAIMMFTISPLLARRRAHHGAGLGVRHARRSRSGPGRGSCRSGSSTGLLNAQIEETFTGHAVVKAFGRQHEVEERFRKTNDELYESSFGAQFMSSLMQPFTMFMGNLQYVIVAVVGGLRVASGAISDRRHPGVHPVLAQLLDAADAARVDDERLPVGHRVVRAGDRVPRRRGAEPRARRRPTMPPPVRGPRRVPRRHVLVRPRPPAHRVALAASPSPGQTVAIVGPTGAGKTTLVNLIMRFYELERRRDHARRPRHLDDPARTSCARRSAWCCRTRGCSAARSATTSRTATPTRPRSRSSRRRAATYVDRFVHSLPDGYDTMINEEGDNISAGEKQLLTIARAFLADPAILILDEATSSVDTRTEVLIQEAMNALRKERTSFVIAHRLSTIRGADIILVMEHGRIVEQGSHNELLAHDGPYSRLYNSQFVAPDRRRRPRVASRHHGLGRTRARRARAESPGSLDVPLVRPVSPPVVVGFVLHRDRVGARRSGPCRRRAAFVVPRSVGQRDVAPHDLREWVERRRESPHLAVESPCTRAARRRDVVHHAAAAGGGSRTPRCCGDVIARSQGLPDRAVAEARRVPHVVVHRA